MKSKKYRILITDVPKDVKIEQTVLGDKFDVHLSNLDSYNKLSDNYKSNVDGIITGHQIKFDLNELRLFKNCKIITRYGIGYDNIDVVESKKKGIKVCVVPDYGVDEVSDHALGMILSLNRSLEIYDMNLKNSYRDNKVSWDYKNCTDQLRLKDSTLGIIGLGRVGTSLARKAKSLNMKVIYYDPFIRDGYDKVMSIKRVISLKEMAINADIVSLHVPYNKKNHNFINENFFRIIKKKIIFINVSRGGLVSSKVLAKYFGKKISKIGLDVFDNEPPNKNDKIIKIWKKKENDGKIIITPHSAFYSLSSIKELRSKAAKTIKNYLINRKLNNCINE